ncbi:MAG: flagellar hook-associated protein FlgL [Gammaproteobacteria bacterium]
MRTPTALFYSQSSSTIQRLQAEITQTQLQISSGRRVLSPSDDPVAASQLSSIESALAQNEQYQRNANLATSRLSIEETTLTDIQNVLFRVRDLAVQANNDTQTVESRRFLAVEAEQLRTQLAELGNRRDGQNNFLFGGFQSRTEPFSIAGGNVSYNGDDGQRQLQIGPTRFVADGDSGAALFMNVPNGNGQFATLAGAANAGTGVIDAGSLDGVSAWDGSTYTIRFTSETTYDVEDAGGLVVSSATFEPGDTVSVPNANVNIDGAPATGDTFTVSPSVSQDIFETVQNFVDALRDVTPGDQANARLHNEINRVLTDVDQSVGNVLDTRSRVGSRLQAISNQENSNADFDLTLQTTRSTLQDVDYTEAISLLNQQITSLQAAQQTFTRVQGLSLFNVI